MAFETHLEKHRDANEGLGSAAHVTSVCATPVVVVVVVVLLCGVEKRSGRRVATAAEKSDFFSLFRRSDIP